MFRKTEYLQGFPWVVEHGVFLPVGSVISHPQCVGELCESDVVSAGTGNELTSHDVQGEDLEELAGDGGESAISILIDDPVDHGLRDGSVGSDMMGASHVGSLECLCRQDDAGSPLLIFIQLFLHPREDVAGLCPKCFWREGVSRQSKGLVGIMKASVGVIDRREEEYPAPGMSKMMKRGEVMICLRVIHSKSVAFCMNVGDVFTGHFSPWLSIGLFARSEV